MNVRLVSVLAVGLAVPLLYLYLSFLFWIALSSTLLPVTLLEWFIVVTAVLRLVVILSLKRFRRAGTIIIVDILSVEVLLVPFLALAYASLGDPIFATAIQEVLSAWPFGLALVVPVFGVYKLTAQIRDSARLAAVLPPATVLFAVVAILESATTLKPQASGLAGFVQIIISSFLGGVGSGAAPAGVAIAGIALFVVLMLYATARGRDDHTSWNLSLILALLGTLVTLGWAVVAPTVTGFAALAFGVPGLALVATVWWVTRAR
jgi:hypothetical protein